MLAQLDVVSTNLQAIWSADKNNSALIAYNGYLYDTKTFFGHLVTCWGGEAPDSVIQKTKTLYKEISSQFFSLQEDSLLLFDIHTRPFRKFARTHPKWSHLFSPELEKIINRYRWKHKLNLLIGLPIPEDILLKVGNKQPLTEEEKQLMLQWYRRCHAITGIHRFHRGIASIVENEEQLIEIETACERQAKLSFLFQTDPKHFAWRKTLVKGAQAGRWIIDEPLGHKCDGTTDNNIHFSLRGESEKVLACGRNEATLRIKRGVPASLLKGPEVYEADPDGKFMIVERLYHPDIERVKKPFVNWLAWLKKINAAPVNLKGKYLMTNRQGVLRTCVPCEHIEFIFTKLENAIYYVAKGNLLVYQQILRDSYLWNHPHIRCLQEIAEKFQTADDLFIHDRADAYSIDNLDFELAAKGLVEKLREIKGIDAKELIQRYKMTGAGTVVFDEVYPNNLKIWFLAKRKLPRFNDRNRVGGVLRPRPLTEPYVRITYTALHANFTQTSRPNQ